MRRAGRWHQPFYGVEDRGRFASFNAFSKHVKLRFACESYLDIPNGIGPERQSLDVEEMDSLAAEQVATWVRQAVDNPGMAW